MESILLTIKKMLGIQPEYTHFDMDIIININSALMGLTQMGLGLETGFMITGITETWADFLDTQTDLEAVKMYIYLKTRLGFDPPSSSFVLDAMQRQATELEWRLNVQVENAAYVPEVIDPEEEVI